MNERLPGSEPIGATDEPNSPVDETDEGAYATCIWNGHEYSPGAYVCRGNTKMVCNPNGHWVAIIVVKCE